jgi:lysophosphatidic acid acyltransferase/lysophosphatidylinositol acyltransferase
MWLLLFAEGTRLNPEKLEASREFARQRNLPLLKHHLVCILKPKLMRILTAIDIYLGNISCFT